MRLGLLGVAMNDDDAVEDGGALARDDAAVRLLASAMRGLVLDQRVMIDMVIAVDQIRAVELALGTLALQQASNVESKKRAAQRDDRRAILAIGRLPNVDTAHLQACVLVDCGRDSPWRCGRGRPRPPSW